MTDITRGRVKRKVELFQTYIKHFGEGLIGTDGIIYSAVATVGATAVDAFDELIDLDVGLTLKEIEVGLTSKTTYLGSAAGSMTYYWKARSEWNDPVGTSRTTAYVNLMGTLTGPVGSAVSNTYEDTWSGYVPVGSVPNAPIRLKLVAQGKAANSFTVKVKNSSYIKLVGAVIPGA